MLKDRNNLRFRIYAVVAAIGAIAVAHRWVTKEDLDLYLVLVEAILVLLVIPNTKRTSRDVPEIHNVE